MKKVLLAMMLFLAAWPVLAANKYDNPDTLVVSRYGTAHHPIVAHQHHHLW